MKKDKQYAAFYGCLIQNKYPYIEILAKRVLEKLGVDIIDLDDFSCCPDPLSIRGYDERTWYAIAARNLAIAEERGLDIISFCNGCYGTLKNVNMELKENSALRNEINKLLAEEEGLHYNGSVHVKDILEVLAFDIGPIEIEEHITRPLTGVTIATHPGCHLLRPSDKILFDDPIDPSVFDRLIEAIGATPLNYPEKMLCCGGSLSSTSEQAAYDLVRLKLESLQHRGTDGIAVVCPYCFSQYDLAQFQVNRIDETNFEIPTFYFLELLGIALGMEDVVEISFPYHVIPTDSVFQKLRMKQIALDEIKRHFDYESLRICASCGACEEDCPVAEVEDFEPHKIVQDVLNGNLESVIDAGEFWNCIACHTCYELCPQCFGLTDFFTQLKNMASKRGKIPDFINKKKNMLLASGRGLPDSSVFREELDLPELKKIKLKLLKKKLDCEDDGPIS